MSTQEKFGIELDLFDKNPLEAFLRGLQMIRESSDKVRRAVFAEVGELKKENESLKKKVEHLEVELKAINGEK